MLPPLSVDDCCCCLWDLEAGKLVSVLQLESPGVEVVWHPKEPMKVRDRQSSQILVINKHLSSPSAPFSLSSHPSSPHPSPSLLPSPLSIPPPLTPHYPLSPPAKLLVAEKSKGIRFYDMNTEVPIMTLDVWSPAHQLGPPLLSVDWSPSNNLVVGGVANGYWAIWDVAQSR